MRLQFTEALLVAEYVFGPFDTENDLRNEGKSKRKASFLEDRLNEAAVICRAVAMPTLAETAEILRDLEHDEEELDFIAGRVLESARRIVAARPPFYDVEGDMSDVLRAEAAARKVKNKAF